MDPSVEFEFLNLDYGLIDEAKDEVYVNIDRECRTKPFIGMNQPTPVGGQLGCEAVLKIKHKGKPTECKWEIYLSDQLIQSGVTTPKGHSGNLDIQMPYGTLTKYKIKIFPPQDAV